MLEEAYSDVLLLYDCCHSAATNVTGLYQGNRGVTEVIAACGYETIAPPVDEHSFTKALTQTLAAASEGLPFSMGELHTRILARLKCWTPCLVKDQAGNFIQYPDGRLVYERQPRRTPIYSIVCETIPRRSIVITPLPKPDSGPTVDMQENFSALSANSPSFLGMSSGSQNLIGEQDEASASDRLYPQIILAIRLEKTELNFQAMRDCLRLLPVECKDIKIEGVYRSFSTLVLLRMPVAIWNLLPENLAYSFVGFVTSENMATMPTDAQAYAEMGKNVSASNRHKEEPGPNEPGDSEAISSDPHPTSPKAGFRLKTTQLYFIVSLGVFLFSAMFSITFSIINFEVELISVMFVAPLNSLV
jgi:hypothetical protein